MAVIRISAKTNLFVSTRSILSLLHRHKYAEVQALGAYSLRRTETAIVRAATVLERENLHLVYRYSLIEADTEGNEKAGVRFYLSAVQEPCSPPGPQGSIAGPYERVPTGPFEGKSLIGSGQSLRSLS